MSRNDFVARILLVDGILLIVLAFIHLFATPLISKWLARELTDETLKKIAHELTESLRKNLSVDWSARENVQAKLRLMVKRILRKYKYPPDHQDAAVDLVLEQVQALGESWAV